jgi:hypothetical protein
MGMTLASWHRHQQPDNPHFDFVLNEEAILRRIAAIAEIRSPEVAAAMASHAARPGA